MPEQVGKVGAFYATSGSGTLQASESHNLAAGFAWLDHKNVLVTNVYVGGAPTATQYHNWFCTPRGKLTIVDRTSATDRFNAKYRWWAEEGETGLSKGIVKQMGGFFNWSFDNTNDVVETTSFDDGGVKSYKATLKGWAGTAERHWLSGEQDVMRAKMGSGVPVIAKFYLNDDDPDKGIGSASDQGQRYEAYAHLTGLSPGLAVDTIVNESLTFQGTGRLSYEEGA